MVRQEEEKEKGKKMKAIKLHMALKNIKRLRQISSILVKHGFYPLLEAMGLSKLVKVSDRVTGGRLTGAEEVPTPVRLRRTFEELGPTFIKLGQILTTRPDIVPDEYMVELMKLQDKVPPLPFDDIKEAIEAELKKPVAELFKEVDHIPLACASMAQVHKAVTHSGDLVVIKVQRPGIEEVIKTDASIVSYLAKLLERYVPESRIYDPTGLAKEFSSYIIKELDFTLEASHTEKFRRNFASDKRVKIPRVYWPLSSRTILTLEYLQGIKLDKVNEMRERGINTKKIAKLLADVFFKQVFDHNLFHGDLHGGNVFVIDKDTLGFIDFGLVGWVDRHMQDNLADILIAMVKEDHEALTKVYLNMGMLPPDLDEAAFRRDHMEILERYVNRPFTEVNIGELFLDYIKLSTRYQVKLPSELLLFDKCLLEIEGLVKVLNPDANLLKESEPYAKKLILRRLGPKRFIKDGIETVSELKELISELPKQTRQILDKVLTDRLTFEVNHNGLEELVTEIDRSSNRLTFGVILAALIIGSSLVMAFDAPPIIFGYPALGIAGFVISAFLGLWLAFQILRSGKY